MSAASAEPRPNPTGSPTRFVLVDSLRALAALSVLFFHVTYDFAYPRSSVWQFLSQRNVGPPVSAVVVFFAISGFVIYRPFARAHIEGRPSPPLGQYAVRRLARIVPAYWVALAVVAVLLNLHYVFTITGAIRYFGFLQLYGKLSTVQRGIGPAWTLCVEITFYAAVPALALIARRLARGRSAVRAELLLCAGLVLVSLAWQAVVFATVPSTSGWMFSLLTMLPGSLDLFAVGMALAVVSLSAKHGGLGGRLQIVDAAPWLAWIVGLGIFYAVGRLAGLNHDGYAAWWVPTHELKAVGAAFLLAPLVLGDQRRGWLRRLLAWRPLIWLGTVSYAIYLWHAPLLAKLAPHLVPHGELVTTLVLTVITVLVAALSWYLIEQPAQRVARRWPAVRGGAMREAHRTATPATSAEPFPSDVS